MKTKTFDCVDMKRRGAERIYEQVKDMTLEEELAYWRQRTLEFRQQLQEQQVSPSEPVGMSEERK